VISGVDRERVWQRDKHEAMRILGAAGVPAGAVLDTQELHDEESIGRRALCE
jgi:crotonobetainyl-CoA:carnitine CoA-transferase CaiB-like acyl-CoA transferase